MTFKDYSTNVSNCKCKNEIQYKKCEFKYLLRHGNLYNLDF